MDQRTIDLTVEFAAASPQLRAVAHRLLGSPDEADDAVQEAWLRASRADADGVANVTAWLTTIVGRICLDMLRARRRRGEELTDVEPAVPDPAPDPAEAAVLADSVGLAMLVVLDRLGPAERIAFVLHDLFAVPFEEIAVIVERTPVAAKKLASRARARVREAPATPAPDLARQRAVVDAFLAASRAGDLDALLAVLDPDAVRRSDDGRPDLRGARRIAQETRTNAAAARYAAPALVDGVLGVVVAPRGRLRFVLRPVVVGDRIAEFEVIGDPARLASFRLALLP